jgi:predicted CoA-binding protein
MRPVPDQVARFLSGRCFAVAGVSRDRKQAANAIYRKLRDSGYEVVPVNPNAGEVEGERCYPSLASVPGAIEGLVVATHPSVAVEVVRQCAEHGVRRVWFHRSFGQGSVSTEAVNACEARGLECIVGGCPLMYCRPVDPFHRCMRWLLGLRGRVPR